MSASTANSSMPSEPSSCPMCARRAEPSKTALAIRRLAPGLLAPLRDQLIDQSIGSAYQLAGDLAGLPDRDLGTDQVKLAVLQPSQDRVALSDLHGLAHGGRDED